MNNQKIEKLFKDYERAFDQFDMEPIAGYYDDTFISAGPWGTIVQDKKDFMIKSKQASEMYRSLGQSSAKIISKKTIPVSNEYAMVTVHWRVVFEKKGDEVIEFDVSYIIQKIGDNIKIILFITHQDEAEATKKLGLNPDLFN